MGKKSKKRSRREEMARRRKKAQKPKRPWLLPLIVFVVALAGVALAIIASKDK